MGKRVRISNESINSYGTRIITAGMDISQFQRNPVLLWMHQRGVVIGLVKDIKVEKDEITGELEFDEATELSRQLKKQWEKGSIRMVSVGIDVLEVSEDKALMTVGQTAPTVTKSKLYEVSLVDIGANDDAITLRRDGTVLSLSKDGENPLKKLVNNKIEERMNERQFALLLGFPEDATKEQIEAKVKELLSLSAKLTKLEEEVTGLRKDKEALTLAAITEAVESAIGEHRLTADRKEQFIKLGKKVGIDDLRQTLAAMTPAVKLSQQINLAGGAPAAKTFSQLSKEELELMKKNDPAQYRKLYKEEYGIELKDNE